MIISIHMSVIRDGNFIGVVGLDLDLAKFAENISQLTFGQTGKITIIDSEGSIVVNTDSSKIGSLELMQDGILDKMANNSDKLFNFNYNDEKYDGVYVTSKTPGWNVFAQIQDEELNKTIYAQRMILYIVLTLSVLASALSAYFFSRHLNKLLFKVIESMDKVSSGDFTSEMSIDIKTYEMSRINESFNNMEKGISSLIKNINNSIEHLSERSVKSVAKSEDLADLINEVEKVISEISKGTNSSADSLGNITLNMEDLSSFMNKVSEINGNLNETAIEAEKLVEKGLSILSDIISKSDATKNSTLKVKSVVEQVSGSINNIKGINETIRGVTVQTNMLALNATIEAARAGEAGRGFAVVAAQIRKLAEETAVSAKKINEIIKEIDYKSDVAVESVEITTNVVEEQDIAVHETKEVFNDMMHSINELTKKIYNMNDEFNSVNKMKDNVVVQVESLYSILEEIAASIEEVNASAEDVSVTAGEFVDEFKDIKGKAEKLSEDISKFKY